MYLRTVVVWACLLAGSVSAQIGGPLLLSEQSWGSAGNDWLFSVNPTPDGGFLLGGFSDSEPGDSKTAPHYGLNDYWVVKVDAAGVVEWDRSFGGSAEDFLTVVKPMSSGGWLLGGYTLSQTNGNKTAPPLGGRDFWIIRLDADGTVLWQQTHGGDQSEYLQDIVLTPDGGCLLAGYSLSLPTGNKTAPYYGFPDYWIVRLDADGNKLWDQSYGGTNSDFLESAVSTPDGGFALAGYSRSGIGGNRQSAPLGGDDFWFLLVDTNGNKTFEAVLGGTDNETLKALVRTADNGFLLGGSSASDISGNKTSDNLGVEDFWLVRLNAAGTKMWDRSYGGSGQEVMWSLLERPDGRLLLGGWSGSTTNGTKTSEPLGKSDWWLVSTDASGQPEWDHAYGGTEDELVLDMIDVGGGDIVLGGYSFSPEGLCRSAEHFGGNDFWLLRITDENVPAPFRPVLTALPITASALNTSGYRFRLSGQSNYCYVAEWSLDLQNWEGFWTNVLTAPSIEITDPGAAAQPHRAYRARIRP